MTQTDLIRPNPNLNPIQVEKLTSRISLKVTPALKRRILARARREERSMNQLGAMAFRLLLKNRAKKNH